MESYNNEELSTGTTIIAIKTKDGIIIGADTRVSSGSYVSNKLIDKLSEITDRIFCCRSGSLADTQIIVRIVKNKLLEYESIDEQPVTVKRAANLSRSIVYNNPSLLAGLIFAGYDLTGFHIYSINLGGALVESEWTIAGSGSPYIYGYCDANFQSNMELKEGLDFVKNAVTFAIKRDNHSGGCVRMAHITKEGVQRYFVPVN
ncbi:hypothetical protein H312_01905 [Anncaliia algerae PRA339]|uniref:proteasome endopeptidase complex n=1 Tax=Anncaliia algerae PRA339 TaxID=1288291 RepID=A0A059F0R0_9MICR|nr:hypothetical protein H312_01905 [Anncaliia algerae PRA339]